MAANRRIALLIATDSYEDDEFPNLRTPCTDAGALADLLGDPLVGAFEVRTLLNSPVQEVRQVLDETFTDARRDDLVLLHVSGHGIKDEAGRLHFVMSDTRRRLLRASAIAAAWVRELIDHSEVRRVVLWLDCCFSGAFPPGFTPKGTETVDAIDQLTSDSGRGCAVMTASTKIQYAFERGQMSLFTQGIVEGLRTGEADLGKDGRIDAGELYSFVYDWVRSRTPNQTPTRNDTLTGDIYLARSDRSARPPVEPAPEIRRSPAPLTKPVPRTTPRFGFVHAFKFMGKGLLRRTHINVNCAALSPAEPGHLCLATEADVQFRSVYSGKQIHQPLPTGDAVHAVAFNPDGKLLAGAIDDRVEMWGPNSESSWTLPADDPRAVVFSPDGTLLACAEGSGRVYLLQSSTGLPLNGSLADHDDVVLDLAFSPDGQLLASASVDQTVRLWPRHRPERGSRVLPGHTGPVSSVAFSPDGQLLASAAADLTVRLWDPTSGKQLHRPLTHTGSVLAVAFSPDGQALVSATEDGLVRVWDPRTGSRIGELTGHPDPVVAIGFTSDNRHLASVDQGGEMILWERTR